MSRNAIPIFTVSVVATATLPANRFITGLGALPAANGNTLGVTRSSAVAGEIVPVDVLGSAVVEAGAAIAAGARLGVDAAGRVVTFSTGAVVGRVAPGDSASGVGDFVEVILIPN